MKTPRDCTRPISISRDYSSMISMMIFTFLSTHVALIYAGSVTLNTFTDAGCTSASQSTVVQFGKWGKFNSHLKLNRSVRCEVRWILFLRYFVFKFRSKYVHVFFIRLLRLLHPTTTRATRCLLRKLLQLPRNRQQGILRGNRCGSTENIASHQIEFHCHASDQRRSFLSNDSNS